LSVVTVTAIILTGAVLLFIWNRIPVVIVAMAVPLAFYATGILPLDRALAGLCDPSVIFIATLFIVGAGLEKTGVTAFAVQRLIHRAGTGGFPRLLALMMLLSALLSALISVSGAAYALLPAIMLLAGRTRHPPSRLLLPMVFAAHAGSMLTLAGSSVNVIVSNAAEYAGFRAFAFFEFALVGMPLLAGTIAIILVSGKRLLPDRPVRSLPADFSFHARTLVEQYGLADGFHRMHIRPGSPLVGLSSVPVDTAVFPDLKPIVTGQDNTPLASGGWLILQGPAEQSAQFAQKWCLSFREPATEGQSCEAPDALAKSLLNERTGLAEVMIPPRSALIGQAVFEGMVTPSGDMTVIAILRRGIALKQAQIILEQGDTLLLQGSWEALDIRLADAPVLVVNSPDLLRCHAVTLGKGAWQAAFILVAMISLLVSGLVPSVVAGLLAAGAMILLGVLTVEQSYNAISWTSVILVGAMLPLSTVMLDTGTAGLIADVIIGTLGNANHRTLLAGLFIVTALLGQLITNAATALIMLPVGFAVARSVGIAAEPVLMVIAIASAAAFLTPVANSANLVVMKPGGYTYGDYWRFGLPLLGWFFVIAVVYVPMVWRL
jgi:di/tricarboxylate transporter